MNEEELPIPEELDKLRQADREDMQGAFICSRETFLELYKVEKRRSLREKTPRCLAHINLAGDLDSKQLLVLEEQLLKVIARELRTGDLACRWKKSHLVLLLPGAAREEAEGVLARLEKKFRQQHEIPEELQLEKNIQEVEDLAN